MAFVFSFLPNEMLNGFPDVSRLMESFTFENYEWIFENIPIFRYVSNSLVMCIIIIAAQVIISSLTAYAFSFFNFKGKDLLFSFGPNVVHMFSKETQKNLEW